MVEPANLTGGQLAELLCQHAPLDFDDPQYCTTCVDDAGTPIAFPCRLFRALSELCVNRQELIEAQRLLGELRETMRRGLEFADAHSIVWQTGNAEGAAREWRTEEQP